MQDYADVHRKLIIERACLTVNLHNVLAYMF